MTDSLWRYVSVSPVNPGSCSWLHSHVAPRTPIRPVHSNKPFEVGMAIPRANEKKEVQRVK